jgi:molecular chaperone HscA
MSGCCQNKERDRIVIGIDFGTSNCLISYVDDDGILKFIHQNKSKSNLIPSRICFGYNLCHFGNEVNEKNDNTVKSIKRIIGLTLPEVLDIESLLPFKIKYFSELDENQDVFIDCGNSISKSVNEIVLEMMKQLRMIIFDHFQIDNESRQRVEIHAVITVPAYFDEKARTIIKKSALLTGIIVMRLINEPTAAALAYSKNSNLASLFDNKSYLVYDLGGGTFDVSIIKKYKDNFFRVLGIGGDKFLGGDDIDVEIKKALVKKNLTGNLNDHDILNKAKEIKENFNSEGILSKDEFEKILMVVINKTLKIMNDVIESTSEKFDDLEIESVILVGGSTRLPTIKDILSKKFKILCDQNPDEIVAVGAGLHAYEIMNKNNSHKLGCLLVLK